MPVDVGTAVALVRGVESGVSGPSYQYYIEVPEGATNLAVHTHGGFGSLDLDLKYGSLIDIVGGDSGDWQATAAGTYQNIELGHPVAGFYFMHMPEKQTYGGAIKVVADWLAVGDPSPAEIVDGSPRYGLVVEAGEAIDYVAMIAGADELHISTDGISGDVSLHVSSGVPVGSGDGDFSSNLAGSANEAIVIPAPSGDTYLQVRGITRALNVAVRAESVYVYATDVYEAGPISAGPMLQNQTLKFAILPASGTIRLRITALGVGSNLTIVIGKGYAPDITNNDMASSLVGNDQSIVINAPAMGVWYYISVFAYSSIGIFTLDIAMDQAPLAGPGAGFVVDIGIGASVHSPNDGMITLVGSPPAIPVQVGGGG